MKHIGVNYDDFDKSGLRENGEKLPLNGTVRTKAKGFKDQLCIEILNPVDAENKISGVVLIFENEKEYGAVKGRLVKELS